MVTRTYAVESEIKKAAKYIIANGTTIRETARKFGIGKSTLHFQLTKLKDYAPTLYSELRPILDKNFEERAVRGGRALQRKKKEGARQE